MQLKFSAIEKASGGLTIPARGMGGDWILKLPSLRFDDIPENEFCIMSLAEKVGIEVSRDPVGAHAPNRGSTARGCQQTDGRRERACGSTIRQNHNGTDTRGGLRAGSQHAGGPQVQSATPMPTSPRILAAFSDERSVSEFSKRLMFAALTGNADMHAKNWSLIYRDGRTPELSPAYDLLCTMPHIPGETMALRLGIGRRLEGSGPSNDFVAVANAAHIDAGPFVHTAAETAERFREIWPEASKSLPVPDAVRSAIETQLTTVPAINGAPGAAPATRQTSQETERGVVARVPHQTSSG